MLSRNEIFKTSRKDFHDLIEKNKPRTLADLLLSHMHSHLLAFRERIEYKMSNIPTRKLPSYVRLGGQGAVPLVEFDLWRLAPEVAPGLVRLSESLEVADHLKHELTRLGWTVTIRSELDRPWREYPQKTRRLITLVLK